MGQIETFSSATLATAARNGAGRIRVGLDFLSHEFVLASLLHQNCIKIQKVGGLDNIEE